MSCVCARAPFLCMLSARAALCLRGVHLVNCERVEFLPKERTWLWLIGFLYGGLRLQDVEINKDTAT